jgi:hypothetical protein
MFVDHPDGSGGPMDIFGKDSSIGWCYIHKQYKFARILAVYLPLGISWILTCLFYFSARQKVLPVLFIFEQIICTVLCYLHYSYVPQCAVARAR